MGDQKVRPVLDGEEHRAFTRSVLADLRVLERLIEEGRIESGVRRIGAEQELFLVDRALRPAPLALEVLEKLDHPQFTTELGRFNLEINLAPDRLAGDCLSRMERQLDELLILAREAAGALGAEVLLTGILPTLRMSDLGLENMTPVPRYEALNRAMSALRGGAYEFYIKGLDELLLQHDNVMLEACNASFQVHFQAGAEEFAQLYNIAQVVAAPVLAVAANSPLLFGRQLWSETRIALFQQSVDTRSSMRFLRERSPRVTFGRDWVRSSVLELFQEDVARFRALVTADPGDDDRGALERGEAPVLRHLRLHTSTVYRWNRACYGVTDGKPHLRIENRVLPAGPTVVDEMANAAFWLGLMSALAARHQDITRSIDFADAKMNFTAAARLGLAAQLTWLDGESLPASRLVAERLVPLARDGLLRRQVDPADVDRYLGIVERRAASRCTGAQWTVRSITSLRGRGSSGERLAALTGAMLSRQASGKPVAEWDPATLDDARGFRDEHPRVEQYMTTDLFTVAEDESVDLVANLMEWRRIRHVPVEDPAHRLVGLVSYRALLRLLARGGLTGEERPSAVSEIMKRDLVTVAPETSILEAIDLMSTERVSCLPVVREGRLVGVITERDLMDMAEELLRQRLGASEPA